MRLEGIRLDLDRLERERDADAATHAGNTRVHFRPAAGTPFARDVFAPRNAAFGQVWIQLERQPAHGRPGLIGMLFAPGREGLLEPALPDVAPRSDYIRDDVDAKWFSHVGSPIANLPSRAPEEHRG
jgi:hypothetical protein